MEQQEKRMIDELFGKLQQAESQSGPRDAEAETFIRDAVAKQPAAPYYMAQAILVQENALQNLNQRVQELEQELANRPAGGGFLGGLFGGGGAAASSSATARSVSGQPLGSSPAANSPSMGMNPNQAAGQQRGGSFMGSALQTAVAVAGGVMLANAVTGMFASEEASAAEAAPTDDPSQDALDQSGGGFDDGGDFDDGGGFDDFGDF